MVNNAQGHIARTRPIDNATTIYDIELNRSRHTRTPTAAGASAAGHLPTPSTSSAETTRPMVPNYGKPPRLPFYRDNHVPRLSVFGTPRHNNLRGPPGKLSKAARRTARREHTARRGAEDTAGLRMSCRCTAQATAHSEADGKEQKKRDRGLDPKSHPQIPQTRASLEALSTTA